MPGKQMAIDADLNAGLITQDEARTRRFEVRAEPIVPDDLREECESCALVRAGLLQVIYTRRSSA